MEEQDGCGLLWLASSELESLKHSGNSLWGTFTSLGLYGQGNVPTLSPQRNLDRGAVMAQGDTFATTTVPREGDSASSEAPSPLFGLEGLCHRVVTSGTAAQRSCVMSKTLLVLIVKC